MARIGYKRMSQRAYAEYLGISNTAISDAVKDGRIKKGWDKKAQKIIVELADKEFGLLHKKTNIAELLADPGPNGEDELTQIETSDELKLTAKSSYGEAKRIREIIQARLAALDLKERKGELVNKDEVYKQLYAFGQQLRIAILSAADRVIDNVLACKTRAEAHSILFTDLHGTLENLATKAFDFTPKEQRQETETT